MDDAKKRIKGLIRNAKTTVESIAINLIANGCSREDVGDMLHAVLHEVRKDGPIGPSIATE